jgi:single-strand DNA-binding protein
MNINHVTLSGNLTRDPELKTVGADRVVAQFTLAQNRKWKTADGEAREEAVFVDCEAWGRTAELLGQYVAKGSPLVVEGRLKLDTWQDKETGSKRSRMKVSVEQIHLLPRNRAEGDGDNTAADEAQGEAPSETRPSPRPAGRPAPRRATANAVDGDDAPPF